MTLICQREGIFFKRLKCFDGIQRLLEALSFKIVPIKGGTGSRVFVQDTDLKHKTVFQSQETMNTI